MRKNIFAFNQVIILLFLQYVSGIKEYSSEFYECLDPDKKINSSSYCSSIELPEADGYKCCSMEIKVNKNNSITCFALENKYTQNKVILDEYLANRSFTSLFGINGSEIEIKCGEIISNQINEKKSDEYTNCCNANLNGVNNENDCQKYNIPESEKGKCCYIETQQITEEGNIINDKRCYIIQDGYFSKEYNLNNYLLDQTNYKNLDQIKNINITINCKNQDVFYFQGKIDKEINLTSTDINSNDDNQNENFPINYPGRKKGSGLSAGAIVGIVIAGVVVAVGATILTIYCVRKNKGKLDSGESKDNMNITDINNNNTENAKNIPA